MSEKFKNDVSKTFKNSELAETFGNASLTAKEIGVLKKLLKKHKGDKGSVIAYVKECGMPQPDEEITAEDWARAGAKHACGVTEYLADESIRGEDFKEDTYESYTTKNRFDRFIWRHLSDGLKKDWKRPLKRDVKNSEAPISYPEGVDESKIHGGGLPHRILPAQAMKNLELARLGKLDKITLEKWGVNNNIDLQKFAINWDRLIPAIKKSETTLELTRNLMDIIVEELLDNGIPGNIVQNIVKANFSVKGFKWEHGKFEGHNEYKKLTE